MTQQQQMAQDESIFADELQYFAEHAGYGDIEWSPEPRKRFGSDESQRGRVTSQRAGFTLTLATDARKAQSIARKAAAEARGLKYAPESIIRHRTESDADAVSWLLSQRPTD
jgi:hypothetical protein